MRINKAMVGMVRYALKGYLPTKEKGRVLVMCALIAFCAAAMAQVPSQDEKIRIAVFAPRDAYPGLAEAQNTKAGEWDYPRDEIRRTAKFMVGGMTAGYNFEYTPSDRARGVAEYFQIEEVRPLGEEEKNIDYTQVWVEEGKVWCWIEFCRTQRMRYDLDMWQKIDHAAISGTGYESVTKGFDGITEATRLAVKDAVRKYYRGIIKNKPHCITGRVLVRKPPKVGISSGRYKVALDFFVETVTIETYDVF